MKSKAIKTTSIFAMLSLIILCSGFTRRDIEEEQRIISESHTDRAKLHIGEAERRIGAGLFNAARVNLLVASYNLDEAKKLIDQHRPKIEQISFMFPRSKGAETIREDYRERAADIERGILQNEDMVTAMAKDLHKKLKDEGGFWQYDALGYLEYCVENERDPIVREKCKKARDGAAAALDKGDLAAADAILKPFEGLKAPGDEGASEEEEESLEGEFSALLEELKDRIAQERDPNVRAVLQKLHDALEAAIASGDAKAAEAIAALLKNDIADTLSELARKAAETDDPLLKEFYESLLSGVASLVENGNFGEAAELLESGLGGETEATVKDLIAKIRGESDPGKRRGYEEELRKSMGKLAGGESGAAMSGMASLDRDIEVSAARGEEARKNPRGTRTDGGVTVFVDPVTGEATEFPAEFEWVGNKLGPKITTTYIGGRGNRLTREVEVSLVRKPDPSNPDVWIAERITGEERGWSLQLTEISGSRSRSEGEMSTTLTVRDASGKESFTVSSWEVRDQSGNPVMSNSEGVSELKVRFDKNGDYTISVVGKTDWGSEFRIRDRLKVEL